uniref:Uncharacterized protein n=1 Tax=viral metagenome TaxID=1070528 RepID=A0A6C0EPA6_9ZZZZ
MAYVPPHRKSNQSIMPQTNTAPIQRERRQYPRSSVDTYKEKAKHEAEERVKTDLRNIEKTDDNFPVLGKGITHSVSWNVTSGRTFSELASDWKVDDDERKEREQREKETGRKENDVFVLPHFRNVRRFSEPEDDYLEEEPEHVAVDIQDEDSGWTRVDYRKYRKAKPEKEFNDEEVMNEPNGEDESVWVAPEEHETCWDERRN